MFNEQKRLERTSWPLAGICYNCEYPLIEHDEIYPFQLMFSLNGNIVGCKKYQGLIVGSTIHMKEHAKHLKIDEFS